MSTKNIEDIEDIDLEVGPPPPLQRMNTSDTEQMITSRKKFEDRVRGEYAKQLTSKEQADIFARGSPETREKQEREQMFEEDPKERREYFEAEMEPWGENGGRRRKTYRKRHYKKKTLKRRSKTNRKYKKNYKKRSTKRPKK